LFGPIPRSSQGRRTRLDLTSPSSHPQVRSAAVSNSQRHPPERIELGTGALDDEEHVANQRIDTILE
jgi:hypothetical protein